MILAAGRGERMRPLTDSVPKPLLLVDGQSLLENHIERLVRAGFTDIVINHAHLGEQIENAIGNGARWRITITYSREGHALETGGGIFRALALLGPRPFLVVNGDIWTDFAYHELRGRAIAGLAHLVLVPNPPHHTKGDFGLVDSLVSNHGHSMYTFSGIGVYHPDLFAKCTAGSFPLAPLLRSAIENRRVTGELFQGHWIDVGTPDRLKEADRLSRNLRAG